MQSKSQTVITKFNNSSSHESGKSQIIHPGMLAPFILVTACFALWGAANNMTDLLVPAFQKVLSMSTLQSSFIQSAFYGAYFFMALPAAFFIQKYSYKAGVVAGLCLYAFGAFLCFPASQAVSFSFFLVAFYVFASGCAILETVSAPYILSMGPAGSATQRINLAQAFNPMGVLLGIYLGKEVIVKGLNAADNQQRAAMPIEQLTAIQDQELSNVVIAYVIVGLVSLVLAAIILFVKFPKKSDEGFGSMNESFRRLKTNTTWKFAVLAQFFYVGTQIAVWTYALNYILGNHDGVTSLGQAGDYTFYGLCIYAAFRFICTFLMSYVSAATLLMIMASVAMALMSIVVFVGGKVGVYALLATYPCMSLMFPTIYGIGLSKVHSDDRKLGGAVIIMSIIGGAILVPFQGWIIDTTENIQISYLMPLVGFTVVLLFSIFNRETNNQS